MREGMENIHKKKHEKTPSLKKDGVLHSGNGMNHFLNLRAKDGMPRELRSLSGCC